MIRWFEYSRDLKYRLVWISNGQKEVGLQICSLDFEWYLKSGSPTMWNPDKYLPFCQKPLKSGQKGLDFEWTGFQMVGTISMAIAKSLPFEIRPSKSQDFKWLDLRSPLYLGFWNLDVNSILQFFAGSRNNVREHSCWRSQIPATNLSRSQRPSWRSPSQGKSCSRFTKVKTIGWDSPRLKLSDVLLS